MRRLALITCFFVAGCLRSESTATLEASQAAPLFMDGTPESGLKGFRHVTGAAGDKWFPESMGGGGGFLDADGDGRSDILLVGGGTWSEQDTVKALRLYRNVGDGSFEDVTDSVGLGDVRAYGFGVTAADYDNDGDDDFYVTTLTRNLLFRNDGAGGEVRFTEVAASAGVAGPNEWSTCSVFFDANADGLLDLYVCNYVEWTPETDLFCTFDGSTKEYCTPQEYMGIGGRFYLNEGNGYFTERTLDAGFTGAPGKALGVVELDYNKDGLTDLFVANDTHRDLLYRNDGDGRFEEVGITSGIAFDERGRARAGMGVDAGIVDSTGEWTIFVGNFSREMIGVYRHAGRGLFVDRAALSRIGQPSLQTLTFGLFLFDYDLDGDEDLFAANGHVQPLVASRQEDVNYAQRPQLFRNMGGGTFDLVPADGELAEEYVARSAANADVDGDGDLDVLLIENGGPVHLLLNEQNPSENGYLRVRLQGSVTNRDGIGSTVVARIGGETWERRIKTGGSYLSSSERVATFGLGDADRVESLVVRWGSGAIDSLGSVQANREILVVEGDGIYATN